MSSFIRTTTIDSADPYGLAGFWCAALGYRRADDDFPGDPEAWAKPADGAGPVLLFVRVPEAKSVKNRVHLDLQPDDRTRDEEVERLLGLGATKVAVHRYPNGGGFDVLADPEGNEFCVLRSAAERAG